LVLDRVAAPGFLMILSGTLFEGSCSLWMWSLLVRLRAVCV